MLVRTVVPMIILLSFGSIRAQALSLERELHSRMPITHAIQWALDPERSGKDQDVATMNVLQLLYATRGFKPLWFDAATADRVISTLDSAPAHGLDPADYRVEAIKHLRSLLSFDGSDPSSSIGRFDVMLTDSVVRFGRHLRFGKVSPDTLDPNWNFDEKSAHSEVASPQAVDLLVRLAVTRPKNVTNDVKVPGGASYTGLQNALLEYQAYARQGGWPRIKSGRRLELGMTSSRIPALRQRLSVTGDLPEGESRDRLEFDAELDLALKRFQERHSLRVDGVLGKATLAALNRSAAERADQIRVNLERARWLMWDLDPHYLLVDIAGFEASLVRGAETVWSSRAVVGRRYRKTPVFRGGMSYVVFNPSWTVPPGILRKDVLPGIQKDSEYLSRKGLNLYDGNGAQIDPSSVDWAGVSPSGFPFTVRQAPGPRNALGRIKFMFPNKHLVFVHDTPSRELFNRTSRTFSSGCVRIEKPLELAEQLLSVSDWSRPRIDKTVSSGRTRSVSLDETLPVLMLYWTVEADENGAVRFRPDIYGRDDAVLNALDTRHIFPRTLNAKSSTFETNRS